VVSKNVVFEYNGFVGGKEATTKSVREVADDDLAGVHSGEARAKSKGCRPTLLPIIFSF
jgi:hypothetical protein